MDIILSQNYADAASVNPLVSRYRPRWEFLYDSYSGGETFRNGAYLTRYQLETQNEYNQRLLNTPYDNHPKSIISTYISFLFRTPPERDLGDLEMDAGVPGFLEDADREGRDLDSFMKQAATWANVFGHSWIVMSKANVGAITRADEIAADNRPYVNLLSPLVVTDFKWTRRLNGAYELVYFKYVEDSNSSVSVIKEWTMDTIQTTTINHDKKEIVNRVIEINELNKIPAVILYNQTSTIRGIGISSIEDIADAARMIYNLTSEAEQGIRLGSHPSLVTTAETNVGSGAGALIHMPPNLDPQLKPYVLEFSGQEVSSVYTAIENIINSIDKMANTGSIRGTEARVMSGISREVEFALLNSRLSEMADNIELAEEQLWKLYAQYQGTTWAGEVEYPDSFSIHDTDNELEQKLNVYKTVEDPKIKQAIVNDIVELLDLEVVEDAGEEMSGNGCPIATQDIAVNLANRQKAIDTAAYGPLNPLLPNTDFWAAKARIWSIEPAMAKKSLCGNCSFFDQTSSMLSCIDQGLSAGGATGDEWDSIAGGQLGYCEAFDFKCKSTRTCNAWVVGGPITDNTVPPAA